MSRGFLRASQLRGRAMPLVFKPQRRTFISQILTAISSPFETLQQLKDTKQMLEDMKTELVEQYEMSKVPKINTFNNHLPGFFGRRGEISWFRRVVVVERDPKFVVVFGALGVGKTALLRRVLSDESGGNYVIANLDLRMAGFVDRKGMAIRLAQMFEEFLESIMEIPEKEGMLRSKEEGGDEWHLQYAAQFKDTFKGHMLGFRQLKKQLEEMEKDNVTSGDISRIMERLQGALLAYWHFEPDQDKAKKKMESEYKSDENKNVPKMPRLKKYTKKMPVILFDESQRLAKFPDCLNALLDAFQVLTHQDRLCNVIHASSDPFYLKNLHNYPCTIFTLPDCTYLNAQDFYESYLLPTTMEKLPSPGKINYKLPKFVDIWDVFGGRLAHLHSYISEFIDSNGTLSPQQCSLFVQAYTAIQNRQHDVVFGSLIRELLSSPTATSDDGNEVMPRYALDYFVCCQKYGKDAIDEIVKSQILDISWTPPATTVLDDPNTVETKKPAADLAIITPPKLHAMARVYEKAMEIVINEPVESVKVGHST